MPRPKKLNADYFPHDKHMRHHRKVKAIEAQFGIVGYAMWCKLLEVLTDCSHFRMVFNEDEIELLAADWGVSAAEISRFIGYCTRLKMIVAETGTIYSPSLIETLDSVLSRREAQAERDRQKSAKNKDSQHFRGVSAAEIGSNEQVSADSGSLPIPATKGKERKGKETKVNEMKKEGGEPPTPIPQFSENQKAEEGEEWEYPDSDLGDHHPKNSGLNNPAPPSSNSAVGEDSYSTAHHIPTLDEVMEFGSANGVPGTSCREFFFHYEACIPKWRARGNDGVYRPFRWPYQLQKWHAKNRRSGYAGTDSAHAGNMTGVHSGSTALPPTESTTETWHIWSYDKAYSEWEKQYGNRPFPAEIATKGWLALWDKAGDKLCFVVSKWAHKGYPTDRFKPFDIKPLENAA